MDSSGPGSYKCLLVKDIAPASPAYQQHGIRTGDFLVAVDNIPASEIGVAALSMHRTDGGSEWHFYHWTVQSREQQHESIDESTSSAEAKSFTKEWEDVVFTSPHACLGIKLGLTVPAAMHALRDVSTTGCRFAFGKKKTGMLAGVLPVLPQEDESLWENFWTLWEAGKWKELLEKTPSYDEPWIGSAMAKFSGEFGLKYRINWRMINNRLPTAPSVLFNAAAAYELGDKNAMVYMQCYHQTAERNWTTDYHALVRYYTAKDVLATGGEQDLDLSNATKLLLDSLEAEGEENPAYQAYLFLPTSPRIATLASMYGIDTSGECSGRPEGSDRFPDYKLHPYFSNLPDMSMGDKKTIAFGDAADRSGAVLIILMGTYRTNGPYSDVMRQWIRWNKAFGESHGLNECHVITGSNLPFRPIWDEGENLAKKQGTPLAVLYDPNLQLHQTIDDMLGGERGLDFAPYTILTRGHTVLLTAEDEEFNDASVLRALSKPVA